VVAVGEVGLDYYYEYSPREKQWEAFEAQLALADEVARPVVVHLRDKEGETAAYRLALEMLTRWVLGGRQPGHGDAPATVSGRSPGVLHSYTGPIESARAALELGFYLGVNGIATFANAQDVQEVVAQVPLERLVVETDCPYLAPQARRGRRNEPAYVPYVGTKVAALQRVELSRAAEVTCANAARLFGLDLGLNAETQRCRGAEGEWDLTQGRKSAEAQRGSGT
jgi:TatD DNase family protein